MEKRAIAGFLISFLCLCLLLPGCNKKTEDTVAPTTAVRGDTNVYINGDSIVTEVVPAVPATTATAANESAPQATEAPVTVASAPADVPLSEYTAQMILDIMASCVNQAKQTKNFSATQQQNVDIQLLDCSIPITAIVNPIIKRFTGEHTFEYTFVDGQCADPKEDVDFATPDYSIPPSERPFTLEPAGLVSWEAKEEGEYRVYTVKLVSENISLDSLVPKYHAQAMDYLDYSEFGVRDLITESNSTYPGATIVVKTTKDGKLYSYEENIPMEGSGTGKVGFSVSASFGGSLYECWTFNW